MYKRAYIFLVLFIVCIQFMQAQKSYSIKGIVKEAASGEPVPYATVVIWNTTQGTATDSVGNFEITGVAPGSYRLQASFLGYKPEVTAEFRVANKDIFYPIELEPGSENLQEVSVVASPFRKTAESPLGLRVIGFKEIEKSAGGNRDKGKRPIMAKEAAKASDRVVITSDNPRFEEPQDIINDMLAGLDTEDRKKTISITDRKEAIRTACMLAEKGDVILVAGKGHENYQEIKGVKHHFDDKEILKELFSLTI